MKKAIIPLLLLLSLVVGCDNNDKTVNVINDLSENKQEEIKILLTDIFNTAKKKNMDKLDSFHLSGPKFSKFGGGIPGRQDYETMTKFEREGFTQVFNEFNFKLQDTKVDIFDDVAIATFILDFNYLMENDSTIYKKKRFSMVFVQDSEQWKIVHEHSSPFIE